MKETRTISWTASTGNEIKITMIAQYGLDLSGNRKTSGRLEIRVLTTVDGESLDGRLEMIEHPQLVAAISNGRKAVGLSQERLDRYNTARNELELIVKENNDKCDAHEAALNAISDRTRHIERQMAYGEES